MAVWFTWPLALHSGHGLIGYLFPQDQYLSVYLLEWGLDVLWTDPLRIFHTPMCHPASSSLASTEHLIGFAPLYAVARLFTSDPIAAYHILILAVFTLNAISMALLVRAWTADGLAAVLAGACLAFAPCMITLSAWLHVISVFLLPMVLLGLDATLWGNRRLGVAVLAGAVAWQVALTVYGTAFGVILGVTFVGSQLILSGGDRPWRGVLIAAATVAAITPLLFVIAWPYLVAAPLEANATLGSKIVHQSIGMVAFDPLGSNTDILQRLGRATGLYPQEPFRLDAGRVPLLLCLAAIAATLVRDSRVTRRRLIGLSTAALAGLLLALGPGFLSTPLGPLPLPLVLLDELPIFGGLRFAERFIILAAIGLAAGAGIAFAQLMRGRNRAVRGGALVVLLLLLAWDAPPSGFRPIEPLGEPPAWVKIVRDGDSSDAILEWPPQTTACDMPFLEGVPGEIINPRSLRAFQLSLQCSHHAARHLVRSSWHWRPTNLCFSSHQPAVTRNLAVTLLSAGEAQEFASLVETAGFRWLLLHRREGSIADEYLHAAGFRPVHATEDEALYTRAMPPLDDVDVSPRMNDAGTRAALSIDLPARFHLGDVVIALVRVRNAGSTPWPNVGSRDRDVISLRAGWRAPGGATVLPLESGQRALLARLPERWRVDLTDAYASDVEVGFADSLGPGETRSWRIQAPRLSRPGRYDFTVSVHASDLRTIHQESVAVDVLPSGDAHVPRLIGPAHPVDEP